MSRALVVLRPEPGNAATAARIAALGRTAIRLPLFEVAALAWAPPDPAAHDALILTSANTLRHGGAGLINLLTLPVYAVGSATADAAETAGFRVSIVGQADATALLGQAEAAGATRALYLGGRDRMIAPGGIVTACMSVYASVRRAIRPEQIALLKDQIVLLHSVRAARAFRELAGDPIRYRIAALSPAILAAAGPGWAGGIAASDPTDAALLAAAGTLAD